MGKQEREQISRVIEAAKAGGLELKPEDFDEEGNLDSMDPWDWLGAMLME